MQTVFFFCFSFFFFQRKEHKYTTSLDHPKPQKNYPPINIEVDLPKQQDNYQPIEIYNNKLTRPKPWTCNPRPKI